jgi:DNA (cytosine-5)-methyltransferase 1
MADLDAVPKTGLRVASLFSGCGGSSLGYRLAGYEVVYANEFVPLAAATYRANSPSTIVDERDVRTLDGRELRERFGEIDLLDGSPPCASFSIAGQRSEGWGKVKPYSSTRQRTDDLFDEYARVVEELRPRAFVAENVAGFAQGVAIGYARRVLARLRAAGYHVEARVLDAQWLGVPQARRRTIIVGIREDVGPRPVFPKPVEGRVSLREALGPHVEGQVCPVGFNSIDGKRRSPDLPSLTVGAGTRTGNGKWSVSILFAREEPDPETGWRVRVSARVRDAFPSSELRYLHLRELRRVQSFPDDFALSGSFNQRWERIGRAVPPLMMRAISSTLVPVLS